ncbi:MAG: metallophosphoesterase, partial [Bacillota bacterium]|nr:metallophosphoesterase [Bacillota bacterium]
SILLSHRPECTAFYESSGFDLELSGHAHGGQLRIPGLLNGLYAPNQGFFPKYAGGLYQLGKTSLLVSRGLCKSRLPRVFNRPELAIIELLPGE